jgi:hypothetical protein
MQGTNNVKFISFMVDREGNGMSQSLYNLV